MPKKLLPVFLTLVFCGLGIQSQAQFNKVLRRTTQKLEREIERRAVEKASDIIAREIADAMEREFDEWLEEAAKRDTSSHYQEGDSSNYRSSQNYQDFLASMNREVDVPESYSFDIALHVEIEEKGEDPQQMLLYLSRDEPIFGMQTAAEKGETQIFVMDSERDAIIMYKEDKKGKTAQAIPSFNGLISSQVEEQLGEYHIEKTGKKETVAGYNCIGYKGSSEDYNFEFYTTDALGITWDKGFGPLMQKFGGEAYVSEFNKVEGMSLKSFSWEKSNDKKVTRWETLEVDKGGKEILNADYDFGKNSDE